MDKVIISDTSCLIALDNINSLDILSKLFQEVIITSEVSKEYGKKLPGWIHVIDVQNKEKQAELGKSLDKGEASSIALALEIGNHLLIIDERKGRRAAQILNLNIIGTIGLIVLAYKKGIITDIAETFLKLTNHGFRISTQLLKKILDSYKK